MNLVKSLIDKILGTNTLYYPGCFTKTMLGDIQAKYENILQKHNIDYITLDSQEFCCGSPLIRWGHEVKFQEIKQKNIEIFNKYAVSIIIVICPACYSMFQDDYELDKHNIQVQHMTQFLDEKLDDIDIDISQPITYHDPCHLWRLGNIYDEPRNVLAKSGYDVQELDENREESICCGWGGGMMNNNPELANQIAQNLLEQADDMCDLTTPCPMCYYQIKNNIWDKDIKVREFAELLDDE